jgi:hypothetical protein
VLRIHDILVWIRIRIWIRGSMPLTNGSGFGSGCGSGDPAIFVIDLQDANKKIIKKKFFCLLLFEGTFTSFSKIKSQKEVKNQSKSRFFLLFLLGDRRLRIHTFGQWIRIRIQEAQKHVDPVDPDPDPQHWYVRYVF